MRKLSSLLALGVVLCATSAFAASTQVSGPTSETLATATAASTGFSIDIGQAVSGSMKDIINALVTGVLTALIGWIAWLVKSKFSIDIDTKMRDNLTAFLTRQASSLIADGAVKLDGVKVNVNNEFLAKAANVALEAIPDTMAYFKLTPSVVEKMIVDMIPKEPSVASAAAVALDAANPGTPSTNPAIAVR